VFGQVLGFLTLLLNYGLQIVTVLVMIQALRAIKNIAHNKSSFLAVKLKSMYLLVSVYILFLISVIF
jgi:hypothetical protein